MAVALITSNAWTAAEELGAASYDTVTSGGSNGVEWVYAGGQVVILNNDSGSEAIFTFDVAQATAYAGAGITIPDETVTVPNGSYAVWRPLSIHRDPTTNKITATCDETTKILVLV